MFLNILSSVSGACAFFRFHFS
uniref:Uncharacterized protein n=1 Tax=Anguilla anguilla TaxID=7936 RepID=A0A0E9PQB3_ANGAN